jgi:glycosyltransferase involved in cell wall biosynthesis
MSARTDPPPPAPGGTVDVLVSTFNSERNLEECLRSARRCLPVDRLLVSDHSSTDRTLEIARANGAEVETEDRGLGYSRTQLLRRARTEYVVFLDSDVIVRRTDFVAEAQRYWGRPRTGAVVGMSMGHRFLYGLPFSLTMLPRRWATEVVVPDDVHARETYYFQRALARDHRRPRYVLDAMEHRSLYRGHKAEWEGANTRRVAGFSPTQVAYAFAVILLIHMNSRSPRNVLYTPIFCAKFLRGFADPGRWAFLDRRIEPEVRAGRGRGEG